MSVDRDISTRRRLRRSEDTATHELLSQDRDPDRNVGAHGTLHNGLSSFEPARLSSRGRCRSVEGRREGAADAEEGEEQGEELEEAEHGERVWWGIDYRRAGEL